MTTPAGYNTPSRIIRNGMEDAGLLQDGDDPTSEQLAKGMQRLQDLINLWQTQGLKLYLLQDITVNLTVGKAAYVFSPTGDVVMQKPLRIVQAYYKNSSNIQRPLLPLAWEEYLRLSNVVQTGAIINYFVDKQATQLTLKVWNVPDITAVTGTVHALTEIAIPTLVQLNDQMLFPPEWGIALRWGYADEVCTGQPQAIMDRCKERAMTYRTALEDWDVEDASTKFTPDTRMGVSFSNFK